MTLKQIFNMVARLFLRKGTSVKKGGATVARRGKGTGVVPPGPKAGSPNAGGQNAGGQTSAGQTMLAQQARDTAKRARKAAQVTRRIGR